MTTIQSTQSGNRHTPLLPNQPSARSVQRLRRWAQTALTLVLFSAVWAQPAPAMGGSNRHLTPRGARDITIFDQNLYVGAEFKSLLMLDPADTNFVRDLLVGVAGAYQAIVASDFPKRAQALASEIAATQPDLVAFQEVSTLRTQVPGDFLSGGNTPATDVQLDYLAILLASLNQHGVHYVPVAIVTNSDWELPMATADPTVIADARLTDHDVILARADLPRGRLHISNPQAGNYQTFLSLPGLGLTIPRGWCSVDVFTRGRTFRLINAHLEENTAAPIQAAQALELLAGPAQTALPVILVGDFNSDANGNDGTATYGLLTQSLGDTWNVLHPGAAGLTWGHDDQLADPTVEFVWRLDLILFRGGQIQPLEMWRLSQQFQATPPLWPSDHAGLVAHLRIE